MRNPAPRNARNERGQMLMLVALLIPVLLGMAAMAVDLGGYASDRRSLQNAADSIALAASKDLPNASAATASAQTWAAKNGINWNNVTFTVTQVGPGAPNPKVSVDINRTHDFAFIKALGVNNRAVGAHAAAIKTSPGGAGGLVPWSVTQAQANSVPFGTTLTVKYDSNNVQNGNFGAIALDGTGSSVYLDTIENGSTSVVCAQGVTGCTTISNECTGSTCPTEPGNMVGKTKAGVDDRMNGTAPECDTFAEVFTGPTNGKYVINRSCNPWLDGGYASRRVVLVPIINGLCNGRCDVTITGFALFWLEGYGAGGCTGNSCEIKGRFVNADLSVNALTGIYDANASIVFTKLSE